MNRSRRAFLRGAVGAAPKAALRPPWSKPDPQFSEACSRCNACLQACPEHIIVTGGGGFPEIDFNRGECVFCGECAASCPEPVFIEPRTADPWEIVASLSDACLAYQSVFCQSCRESCEAAAIAFSLRQGRAAVPMIDAECCTGCGACVAVCPVGAIAVAMQNTTSAETV